jgi:hypothetical protein
MGVGRRTTPEYSKHPPQNHVPVPEVMQESSTRMQGDETG